MNIAANASAPKPATHVAFFPGIPDARVEFNAAAGLDPVEDLVKRYPDAGVPKVAKLALDPLAAVPARRGAIIDRGEVVLPDPTLDVVPERETEVERAERIGVSGWDVQKTDETARARITAQHDALRGAGVKVDERKQLFATGTRMAAVGYQAQEARAKDHERKQPLREAAEQLIEAVRSENRADVVVTARDLSQQVSMNGKLTCAGFTMQEQAIRGALSRIESPALSYVFGLRNRIAETAREIRSVLADPKSPTGAEVDLRDAMVADKKRLAGTLAHEFWRAGDAPIKLRTRVLNGVADAYAAVSTRYEPADAPEVLAQILKAMPADAKGSWSYDPATTSWELRAELWTPTPVAEQAVGEPFRGYVSFRSKDNGTGSLKGGGGIEIIACLNASTYVADSTEVNRRHIGAIVAEAEKMVAAARQSIDALTSAWGVAREEIIELPAELESMVGLPISKAIPGFWWGEFGNKKSELSGVLPGRTKDHVAGLTEAYLSERRDEKRIVRADFAQAWTRYIQGQPTEVRREAESAVASWMVERKPMRFDGDRVTA